jgi:hypothetical protein
MGGNMEKTISSCGELVGPQQERRPPVLYRRLATSSLNSPCAVVVLII